MTQQKRSGASQDEANKPKKSAGQARQRDADGVPDMPKTESTAEYEGARNRKPTGNPPVAPKTETSRSSGE